MKQTDNKSCVAVVLAMIVGETEQYVKDWMDHAPPYNDTEAYLFLAHHGVMLGTFLVIEDGQNHGIHPDETYEVSFAIKNRPAYVLVRSESPDGLLHAIFWDGKQVWDPNPSGYIIDVIEGPVSWLDVSRRR